MIVVVIASAATVDLTLAMDRNSCPLCLPLLAAEPNDEWMDHDLQLQNSTILSQGRRNSMDCTCNGCMRITISGNASVPWLQRNPAFCSRLISSTSRTAVSEEVNQVSGPAREFAGGAAAL